jgi:hypothetical protein
MMTITTKVFGQMRPGTNCPRAIAQGILAEIDNSRVGWAPTTRFLAILPFAYVVAHTRSVRVAVVAHIVANAVDLITLLVYLNSR